MKIYILDREYEFDNNMDKVDDIVQTIYRESSKRGRHLAYAVIDGRDIYGNFGDYIEQNIESIESIKVVTMTFKEMIANSIMSIKDYLEEEKSYLPVIANNFKRGADEESIKDLDDLLEGVGWIIEYFQRVDSTHNLNHVIPDYYIWNEYAIDVYKLGNIINSLDDIAEKSNDRKIGETIEEIIPLFESMVGKLDKLYRKGTN